MHDQRWNADHREDVANVDLHVHPHQRSSGGGRDSRPGGAQVPHQRRKSSSPGATRAAASSQSRPRAPAPCRRLLSAQAAPRSEGPTGSPSPRSTSAYAAPKHQTGCAVGVGGGKEDRHRPALDGAEEHRALGAGCLHDRADVVHPLIERRYVADAVRDAGAPLVETDETTHGGSARSRKRRGEARTTGTRCSR